VTFIVCSVRFRVHSDHGSLCHGMLSQAAEP
jgi:hypothetical protein